MISQDLESMGVLRRSNDPSDRRGIQLTLSERGNVLISDSVAAIADLERSYSAVIGAEELVCLQQVSSDIYHALHLTSEIQDDTGKEGIFE